jgi:hypothetical protein
LGTDHLRELVTGICDRTDKIIDSAAMAGLGGEFKEIIRNIMTIVEDYALPMAKIHDINNR